MSTSTGGSPDPSLAGTLLLARRGTEFFTARVGELDDARLRDASALEGWTRAHVVAHVGHNAQGLGRLVDWARTGVETPMYESMDARDAEIERTVSASVDTIRRLQLEEANRLEEKWDGLPSEAWSREVRTMQGRVVPVAETAWMRGREVWLHAIDLDSGASAADLPAEFVDRLLAEVVALWRSRGDSVPQLTLRPDDRDHVEYALGCPGSPVLSGQAAQIVAWATGRASHGLTLDGGGDIPPAPHWL